ncbi:DsbA family oxidoreductase [Streptomyces sp. BH104]|uniref:DsbA family oxidoreductase n=1 Tax=Streptomyces sp. BH104 TaxID=3410407 RepID=UPI003BB71681
MNREAASPASDGRSTVVADDPAVVTVWSDIGCPWAALALHVLRGRAAATGTTLLVDHRAFPLELFNRRPTPKPVIDMEVVAIAGLVPEVGWRLWREPDSAYAVTTLPAMAAVQAAKDPRVGGFRAADELDAALRTAFYRDHRCISVHAEILAAAETCPSVDVPALERELARGAGHAEVFRQFRTAQGPRVQGSPHLFVGHRYAAHNPGVEYHWTGRPGQGFPRFERYDRAWADHVLGLVASAPQRPNEPS